MRKNSISIYKIALALVFCSYYSSSFGQNDAEIAKIVSSYDLKKLSELQKFYLEKSTSEKKEALAAAKLNNWPEFIKNENGSVDELIKLTPDGQPMYYSVDNKAAAKSTRANFLNTGGGLGLALDGQGMTARVWDGGNVRPTHQEFGTRVNVIDTPTAALDENSFHSTHVTGTIGAQGIVANAKGMAPMAQVRTFNWTADSSEALAEVQNGMLLSNHSYGVPIVSRTGVALSPALIGSYTSESREWDVVTYNAPYYLMVVSAGNNGQDANTQPSTTGYDKLVGNKVSKNNLVVANTNDANINANGDLVSVSINGSSSQGPSDDFRIKPDISGNGTQVYSTLETSNTAYGNLSGTSMAAPNVTGTLLLLQQHYNNLNGHFMKAATLKALACHTADDAGRVGPDAIYGWGLLNAKKAAETITENGLESIISELSLAQGQTYTTTVSSNGMETLNASIVWSDVPGTANNNVVNSTNPALVNDLDIRVTKNGTTYFPWKLQSTANLLATNVGDNNVDTVERVTIPAASGTYTITVTHKGNLQQGPQNFSLVVTGIVSSFSLTSLSENQTICNTQTASYNFKYATANATSTNFSVVDLPGGANANFNTSTLSANGDVTMTLSNLQSLASGEYTIGIKGDNGIDTRIEYVKIKVYSPNFQAVNLTSPANNAVTLPTNVRVDWTADANANSYRVQASTDANFSNIIINTTSLQNNYVFAGLNQQTKYFWRVYSINTCGESSVANVYNFSTGIVECNNTFVATDFTNNSISTLADVQATVPVTVTGGFTIGNMTATINLPHTALRQLSVYLEGPAAIGSPRIKLFDQACDDNTSINAVFSDAGSDLVCGTGSVSVTGITKPFETLSSLNGLSADGVWTLIANDNEAGNGGRIARFSLSFCNLSPALSVNEKSILQASVYPNPTKGIINIKLSENNSEKTILNLYDIQGRNILSKESNNNEESLNIENLSDGIYMLSIQNGNLKTTKKIVLNR